MTPFTPIDAAALAQARERLEAETRIASHVTITRDGELHDARFVELADLRLVLDALKEARRQAFEEMAYELRYRLAWRSSGGDKRTLDHCTGLVTAAAQALAAEEQA